LRIGVDRLGQPGPQGADQVRVPDRRTRVAALPPCRLPVKARVPFIPGRTLRLRLRPGSPRSASRRARALLNISS
jgi:hypothetical protein